MRPLLALGGEVDGLSFPHQAEHKLADAEQKQNVTPDTIALKVPLMIPIVLNSNSLSLKNTSFLNFGGMGCVYLQLLTTTQLCRRHCYFLLGRALQCNKMVGLGSRLAAICDLALEDMEFLCRPRTSKEVQSRAKKVFWVDAMDNGHSF